MAKTVKQCLNGWELGHVLSVTMDNASLNYIGIQYLKRWLLSQNGLVLNGEYLHTRCCAHVLNLIVKDGMSLINVYILRIRGAVKYVRRSSSRFHRFKKCIDLELNYKDYAGLDSKTRWNSTYTMLNVALKHEKTFTEFEFKYQKYVNEVNKEKDVPTPKDWEHVALILPFLKLFHEATVSGSSYLTSNLYMFEVFGVKMKIVEMSNNEDEKAKSMVKKMKAKYEKYWGDPTCLNMLLIAIVLH